MDNDIIHLKDQNFSYLGKGSKVKGEFYLRGVTHILSHLEGDIVMEDQSDVSIEHEGAVKGSIKCNNLEIYGKFEGDLNSVGKVVIYPTASVSGKVQAKSLTVHPGASLNIQGHTNENLD